jgi:hypothetical protein
MAVGDLYNASGAYAGQAVLYIAPPFTPMAADSSVLFDPTNWTGKTLTANGATSITLSISTAYGTVTTAAMASFATATAATVDTAIETALAGLPSYTPPTSAQGGAVRVTGAVAGGPFALLFDSRLGAVVVTVSASTGGTGPTITSPGWFSAGGSEQGWSFGGQMNVQTLYIEEQTTPVGRFIVSRDVSILGSMAEDVMLSWQVAMNMTKTVTAAASGQPAKITNTLSDNLVHYAAVLEMANEVGLARRFYVPDTVSSSNVTVPFRRASALRTIPLGLGSVCQTNLIRIDDIRGPTPP